MTRALEECDGSALGGKSCAALGFIGGSLECSRSCTLDTSACTARAESHPFSRGISLPDSGPFIESGGDGLGPAAIAVAPPQVGAAWRVPDGLAERSSTSGSRSYALGFGRTDDSLAPLLVSPPFARGAFGRMVMGGSADGWLLAVETYAHMFAPTQGEPASTHVFAISPRGHVRPELGVLRNLWPAFVARGGVGEPSLVGVTHIVGSSSGYEHELLGVVVSPDGTLGTPVPLVPNVTSGSALRAFAVPIGKSRFLVARGTTLFREIAVAVIDAEGSVVVGAAQHPDLRGNPIGLIATERGIVLSYVRAQQEGGGAYIATLTAEGALASPPEHVAIASPVALFGAKPPLMLLTRQGGLGFLDAPATAHQIFAAPRQTFVSFANGRTSGFVLRASSAEPTRMLRVW